MTDLEQVIAELQFMKRDVLEDSDKDITLNKAIALLKEQEAVKPIKKDAVEITARYGYECPCGGPLLIGQPYCANCGRQVKWE